MLHYLPRLHKQTDRFHRDASTANELAPPDPLLPTGSTESLGRSLPLKRRLRVHLPLLRH